MNWGGVGAGKTKFTEDNWLTQAKTDSKCVGCLAVIIVMWMSISENILKNTPQFAE